MVILSRVLAAKMLHVIPNPGSVQLGDLLALLKALMECQTNSVNIFPDNQ